MATVRFVLVGVCKSPKNMLGCLVLLITGTRWGRNDFLFPEHVCVEHVVAGTPVVPKPPGRACQEVACILLLSGFQCCFDDGGLFLVMDAG